VEREKGGEKIKGSIRFHRDIVAREKDLGTPLEEDLEQRLIPYPPLMGATVAGRLKKKLRKRHLGLKESSRAQSIGGKIYKKSRGVLDRIIKRLHQDSKLKHEETVEEPSALPGKDFKVHSTSMSILRYRPRGLRIRLNRRRVLIKPRTRRISSTRGVEIDYMDYEPNRKIAILPTIITATLKEHFSLDKREVRKEDIKVEMQKMYAQLVIMVVLDASLSMKYMISKMMDLLASLKIMAWRKRDKIGLILCAGDIAQIIAHPTTNINVLRRKFSAIKIGGRTPLAAGMLKAMRILHIERSKNPDIIPVILLISDGLANAPLKIQIPELFYEMCPIKGFADTLYAAYQIRRKKLPVIVLNPVHEVEAKPILNWTPTKLMQSIAKITDGIYIGIPSIHKPKLSQLLNEICLALNIIAEKYSRS